MRGIIPFFSEQARDCRKQLLLLHRLGEEAGGAFLQRAIAVLCTRAGCHHQHWNPTGRGILAEVRHQVVAVESRHLDVGDHQVASFLRHNLGSFQAGAGQPEEAIGEALELEAEAQKVLESAPKTNEMLSMWLRNTVGIIKKSVPLMIAAIQRGDDLDVAYIAEELSRTESSGSEIYESQAEMAMNGLNPFQETEQNDGEEEEF